MINLAIILFFGVLVTGPDGRAAYRRRKDELDAPSARVTYLPSEACRLRGVDPVLLAVRARRALRLLPEESCPLEYLGSKPGN